MINSAPKCEIKQSLIHGLGLFAREEIAAGEEILKIRGTLVSSDKLDDGFLSRGHWQGVAPGWCLISEEETSFAYINHQAAPNALVDLQVMAVIALRSIKPGEEVTIDYAKEPMDERCRKIIGPLKSRAT